MSDNTTPGLLQTALVWGGAIIAWLAGESGRVLVAGGLGGLLRWSFDERRRIRDGVINVITGAICAKYLGAFVLALLAGVAPSIRDHPDAPLTAGFSAGLVGMSLAKILIAIVEARAHRAAGGGDDAT